MADLSDLSGDELAYAEALVGMVEQHGQVGEGSLWVGYETADENEDREIGVRCGNCVFAESESECEILEREIELGARCRMVTIPPGLVASAAPVRTFRVPPS